MLSKSEGKDTRSLPVFDMSKLSAVSQSSIKVRAVTGIENQRIIDHHTRGSILHTTFQKSPSGD